MSRRVRTCRFCHEPVRYQQIIVGTRGKRKLAMLTIDAQPHDGGRVIEYDDGGLRLLVPWEHPPADAVTYRVHSLSECRPNDDKETGDAAGVL